MRSSDKCESFGSDDVPPLDHFSRNQVNQFEIPLHVHHEILRLEIPHYHSLRGQVLKDQDHRSYVKLSVFSAKEADLTNGIVKFLSMNKFNEGVEIVLILETFVVLHDEGMIQTSQKIFLLGNVLEKRVLLDLLLAVRLQHVQFLLLHLVQTPNQQNRPKFSLLQLLKHDQLVQAVDKFVPLFYLLVEFLGLPLLVFLNNSVHEPSNNLFDNISFDLSDNPVGFHNNVIFIPRLGLVLKQKFLPVDLRTNCNGVDILVFFESPLDYNNDLLIVDVLSVLLYDHVSCLVAVDLHQIKNLLDLLL